MNHLAHLFLAGTSAESLIGNLAGDFVKGVLGDELPPAIRAGIVQHRRIDSYTDAHPDVGVFRRVIAAEHGHYARVIADIFIDHFLACRFDEFGGEPLESFLARTYAAIDPHTSTLPGRLRLVYPHMRDEQWLLSYRTLEGIRTSLAGISRRFSRRPQLAPATHLLTDARQELERRFEKFFPEVMEFARTLGPSPGLRPPSPR